MRAEEKKGFACRGEHGGRRFRASPAKPCPPKPPTEDNSRPVSRVASTSRGMYRLRVRFPQDDTVRREFVAPRHARPLIQSPNLRTHQPVSR